MRVLLCLVAFLFTLPALAQEEEEKGRFVRFVEDKISTDNFRISLNGLEGSLSSSVALRSITVADRDGVYLTVEQPRLEWNRSALLRGKLDVERLTAERITYSRAPVADESLPDPEAQPFAIPELPVTVEVDRFEIGEIVLTKEAIGRDARLSTQGRLTLDDGTLDLDLTATRLDGPGGSFKAIANVSGAGESIAIDVALEEPQGGVVATLLGLEGTPPVSFTAKGEGSLEDLTTNVRFAVDGREIVNGPVKLTGVPEGTNVTAQLGGPLASILPQRLRPFVGDTSQLALDATIRDAGGTVLNRFDLDSGSIDLSANAFLAADGFLSALNLDARLKDNQGDRIVLDLGGRSVSVADADLTVRYDANRDNAYRAKLITRDLRSPQGGAELVDVTVTGSVTNPQDAATREVTFDVNGVLGGLAPADEAVAKALGDRVTIKGSGATRGGGPIRLNGFEVSGDTFNAALDGAIENLVFDGRVGLDAADLNAFSALAGRDLGGAVNVSAQGKIEPNGAFDLALDGTTRDLKLSEPRLDPILAGTTRLEGGASRGIDGLRFRTLRLANDQARVDLDGRFASTVADLKLDGRVENVGLVEERAEGPVEFSATVMGEREENTSQPFQVNARVAMPSGALSERKVEDLAVTFDGTTDGANVAGKVNASGFLGGETVSLDTRIDASAKRQSFQDLVARVGRTSIDGSVTRNEAGLFDGTVEVASEDVSALAALALQEASGALNGTVRLAAANGSQSVDADVTARDLAYAENRVGSADIDATVTNAFEQPKVDAEVNGRTIEIGGVKLRSVEGTIATQGNRTTFDVRTELEEQGARLAARGAVIQDEGRLRVELDELTGRAKGAEIRLQSPASVTIEDGVTSIEGATLAIGGGTITVSGTAGETLDIRAEVSEVPLDVVNAVAPQLGLGGRVSGTATVSGTAANPTVEFTLRGAALSADALRKADVAPLDVETTGRFADNALTLQSAAITNGQGVNATVSGTVPLSGGEIDLAANIERLPLALANVAAPDLALRGDVSGTAEVGGTLAQPDATFDLRAAGVSTQATRDADVAPLDATARGRFADNTLTLQSATVTNDQGVRATASGTVPLGGGSIDVSADIERLPLSLANAVAPDLGLQGDLSGEVQASGTLSDPQATFDLSAADVSTRATRDASIAPLAANARGRVEGRTVRIETASVTNPQGLEANLSGTVPLDGGAIDVSADVDRAPLALADAVAPELDLSGSVSAEAQVSGTLSDPRATFSVEGRDISAAPLRQQGISPVALDASGSFANSAVQLDSARLTNGQGISVSASGTVPVDGGPIDVDVSVDRLPASLANAVRPELDARGEITGTAQVSGTASDPRATFDIRGSGLSAAPLAQAGVDPIALDIAGSYDGSGVTIASANARNGQGVDVTASGRVPLDGGSLDVSAEGTAPLSLANAALADRGARATGTVRFNAQVTGPLSDPRANGLVSVADGAVVDPLSNVRLTNVSALASLNGDTVDINRASAQLASGGSVSVSGTIGLGDAFPVNLAIDLDNARYSDGETFTTTADGDLRVTGALLADPLLSGTVNLARTEITVPENFGGSADLLDVKHIRPTPAIVTTLERLARATPVSVEGAPTGRPSVLRLDVQVNAPNRIFVRGRGLDAELGGSVLVRGPANDVRPTGSFELIRGRLSVIGRRFTLDEGSATLTGDLDPFLRFRATTTVDGVEASVILSGRASDLQVTFESNPELPPDEVLALIIFGRSLTDLSPAQIARLVAIAQELTGGGGPGVVERLRRGTGLDDLDVVSDAEGNTAVRAGKYVSDNVYLGVQAGRETEATINLDITRSLTARGTVGSDGNSKLGIFFEKDY